MSNLIPESISYDELADILDDMSFRVRRGDSFEGWIQYNFPEEDAPPGFPEDEPGKVWVSAGYRIGNTMGQGGMRLIGKVPE